MSNMGKLTSEGFVWMQNDCLVFYLVFLNSIAAFMTDCAL
jgi:hypothetical protein